MRVRLDTSLLFVDMFRKDDWPVAGDLARDLFDSALSQPSKVALRKPADNRAAMTLLLMLPEFQRR